MSKAEIDELAQRLFDEFAMAITGQLLATRRTRDRGRAAQLGGRVVKSDLSYAATESAKHFRRAARYCAQLEADPHEYVAAQFSRMEEMSSHLGRVVIPTPAHISTLAAQVRYVEYKRQKAERRDRAVAKPDDRSWYREERKLRGLARVMRKGEDDVLAERPEEFSREFLEHRGIWDLVREDWEERVEWR